MKPFLVAALLFVSCISLAQPSLVNTTQLSSPDAELRHETSTDIKKTYVLPTDSASYLYDVVDILIKHGVGVKRSSEDFADQDVLNSLRGNSYNQKFRSGDIIVSANQPRYLLINSISQPLLDTKDLMLYDIEGVNLMLR